ncbi:MAG: hypothetical protein KF819_26555 [Labilithrix sp.]|nr:hypothetical protein [Labilithrix sp.]
MPRDDNESEPLPPSVERALAEARASANRAGGLSSTPHGRWLALIPVGVAIVMALLVMPRAAAPEDIPLPAVNARALAETKATDRKRADRARATRLPTDVLAMGTALRALGKLQATGAPDDEVSDARAKLEDASRFARSRDDESAMLTDLLALRALHLEEFIAEVERFEVTGTTTSELQELGGGFVDRMRAAGWTDGKKFVLTDAQRRTAYKLYWNATTATEKIPELAPTLDEQRALYTLYLTHPHPPEVQRPTFEAQRRTATDDLTCRRANEAESRATELWRAEKVRRLGEIDAAYPGSYALGVAYYRAGRMDLATDQFRRWIERHPDGAWTLRAKNHLRAAVSGGT